jgi:hypothetical protein
MARLKWEQMKSGTLNAKVGCYHLFSVAYHTGDKAWYVFPKIKGQPSVSVQSQEQGIQVAERLYQELCNTLVCREQEPPR